MDRFNIFLKLIKDLKNVCHGSQTQLTSKGHEFNCRNILINTFACDIIEKNKSSHVVDVRKESEFLSQHMISAKLAPLSDLSNHINKVHYYVSFLLYFPILFSCIF